MFPAAPSHAVVVGDQPFPGEGGPAVQRVVDPISIAPATQPGLLQQRGYAGSFGAVGPVVPARRRLGQPSAGVVLTKACRSGAARSSGRWRSIR